MTKEITATARNVRLAQAWIRASKELHERWAVYDKRTQKDATYVPSLGWWDKNKELEARMKRLVDQFFAKDPLPKAMMSEVVRALKEGIDIKITEPPAKPTLTQEIQDWMRETGEKSWATARAQVLHRKELLAA